MCLCLLILFCINNLFFYFINILLLDDYINDNIGSVLLTRASKSIWAKSKMTIRNQSCIPTANMLICTNEDIIDLRVEGKNKEEVYKKMSVIDLGEIPMSKSNSETRAEFRKKVISEAKIIRKHYPSFLGCMLQVSGQYITSEEFKEYEDMTKHERLGNILKNVQNLYTKLSDFCEQEDIPKPKSLRNKVSFSCLTNKSVLAHKGKSPTQIVEILIKDDMPFVLTQHNGKDGIAFDVNLMKEFPWYRDSFDTVSKGKKVFEKMRTRLLNVERFDKWAYFLGFEHLKQSVIDDLRMHATNREDDFDQFEPPNNTLIPPLERIINDVATLSHYYTEEYRKREHMRVERFNLFDSVVSSLQSNEKMENLSKYKCKFCSFVAKSKGGLANHTRSCKKKQ